MLELGTIFISRAQYHSHISSILAMCEKLELSNILFASLAWIKLPHTSANMDHFPSLDVYRVRDEPLRPADWLGFDHGNHDPCALEQYPLCRGWEPAEIQALRDQDISQQFSTRSLAMIQSWMFLGALEALTQRRISEVDFLRNKFKRAAVHTGFLRSYLVDWIKDVRDTPDLDHESLVVRINNVMSEAQFWCYKLAASVSSTTDVKSRTILRNEIDSAARLLTLVGEAINSARAHLPRAVSANTIGFSGCYTPDEASRLIIRLVNKGWCPYMARILSGYRYSVAEYAAFYNKLRSKSMPSHETSQCTEARCLAYDVGPEYSTRHVSANCDCSFVSPPLAKILDLLRKGKIPVLSQKNPKEETIQLEVSCSTAISSVKGYVAFSHVWSDGMGSDTETGLPQCVLRGLLGQAQGYGRQHIWIDSLCVPHEKTYRREAIRLMAKTYEDASITVVLDSSIRTIQFDLTLTGIERTLLHLVTSTWMQRLWTLQEACLSRLLIFQFKNTMAITQDIHLGLVKVLNDQWHVNPVLQVLGNEFLKLIRYSDDTEDRNSKKLELGDLSRMLMRRRTSKLVDETAAVAGLVRVNVTRILEKDSPEERMKIFLAALRKVPSDIIMSPLPRLKQTGFRWAPESFMSCGSADRRWGLSTGNEVQWAECFPGGGLRGQYSLTKLSQVVCLGDLNAAVYGVGKHVFKANLSSSNTRNDNTCEFNTFATLPHLQRGSHKRYQLAAALMPADVTSTGSWEEGLAAYEYKGRVQILNWSWELSSCQIDLFGWDEGIRDIYIL